jgi:hypothetical protein
MSTKIKPQDNSANMPNANKSTPGTNKQYDQVQGNRGKQIQQTQQSKSGSGEVKAGSKKR